MRNRLQYFDVIKLAAILWIFLVHFISTFKPDLFRFWDTFPTSLILGGITGKFATAVLAVILGYFAYHKGTRDDSLTSLILKRYLNFFIMGLFANIIYTIYDRNPLFELATLKELIITSVVIGEDMYINFWCMQSFFLASVLSYINGKYGLPVVPVMIECLIFMLTQDTWIALCLLGNILYRLIDMDTANCKFQKFMAKPVSQIILVLLVLVVINQPESDVIYFIDGIGAVILITIVAYNQKLRKILSNNVLAYLGKHSMGIFVLHSAVYGVVGNYILSLFHDTKYTFLAALLISVLVTIPLSIVLVKTINKCTCLVIKLFVFLKEKWTPCNPGV